MVAIGVSVNPVLSQHLMQMGIVNWSEDNFFTQVKKISETKGTKYLIYNVSYGNVILALAVKIYGGKYIYHLHDPIPHSGWKNIFVFCANYLLVKIADEVVVFHKNLSQLVNRYYKRTPLIIPHGMNKWNRVDIRNISSKICLGIFGRNMPYKNYVQTVKTLRKKYGDKIHIYVVGKGYPKDVYGEDITIKEGYIKDDEYYSLMCNMDYIVVNYLAISYSGVISDANALKIPVLGNEKAKMYSDDFEFIGTRILKTRPKECSLIKSDWSQYGSLIQNW